MFSRVDAVGLKQVIVHGERLLTQPIVCQRRGSYFLQHPPTAYPATHPHMYVVGLTERSVPACACAALGLSPWPKFASETLLLPLQHICYLNHLYRGSEAGPRGRAASTWLYRRVTESETLTLCARRYPACRAFFVAGERIILVDPTPIAWTKPPRQDAKSWNKTKEKGAKEKEEREGDMQQSGGEEGGDEGGPHRRKRGVLGCRRRVEFPGRAATCSTKCRELWRRHLQVWCIWLLSCAVSFV